MVIRVRDACIEFCLDYLCVIIAAIVIFTARLSEKLGKNSHVVVKFGIISDALNIYANDVKNI